MSSKTAKFTGIILTTALLAGVSTYTAAAQGPIESCVVNAVREAPMLEQAVNHCYWDHYDSIAQYN